MGDRLGIPGAVGFSFSYNCLPFIHPRINEINKQLFNYLIIESFC